MLYYPIYGRLKASITCRRENPGLISRLNNYQCPDINNINGVLKMPYKLTTYDMYPRDCHAYNETANILHNAP